MILKELSTILIFMRRVLTVKILLRRHLNQEFLVIWQRSIRLLISSQSFKKVQTIFKRSKRF